jgi:predicted Zn-dependent peptidase
MRYNDTIKVGTLPNGLTIVTDELAHVNTNYAAIIVHTGGWHDPLDKPGLAHFSEHLIAHGFSDMTDEDFLERVNELVLLDFKNIWDL